MTYSFVPNLVWLPSQLSKLSDREGSFVQTLLQAIARKIYLPVAQEPGLRTLSSQVWALLPERPETAELDLPDVHDLNYFEVDEGWLTRRVGSVAKVAAAVSATGRGVPLTSKVIATRYGAGLAGIDATAASKLDAELVLYLNAISQS
jgi:hypothetical protein